MVHSKLRRRNISKPNETAATQSSRNSRNSSSSRDKHKLCWSYEYTGGIHKSCVPGIFFRYKITTKTLGRTRRNVVGGAYIHTESSTNPCKRLLGRLQPTHAPSPQVTCYKLRPDILHQQQHFYDPGPDQSSIWTAKPSPITYCRRVPCDPIRLRPIGFPVDRVIFR